MSQDNAFLNQVYVELSFVPLNTFVRMINAFLELLTLVPAYDAIVPKVFTARMVNASGIFVMQKKFSAPIQGQMKLHVPLNTTLWPLLLTFVVLLPMETKLAIQNNVTPVKINLSNTTGVSLAKRLDHACKLSQNAHVMNNASTDFHAKGENV